MLLFVAAGAVEAGDPDVVEAEVDAENWAVVDDVLHKEAADDGATGQRGDHAFPAAERLRRIKAPMVSDADRSDINVGSGTGLHIIAYWLLWLSVAYPAMMPSSVILVATDV